MTDKNTAEIIARRRAALYNIKAQNSGFKDYFGRDIKKERELEIERNKLLAALKKNGELKDVDSILLKPGDKKNAK